MKVLVTGTEGYIGCRLAPNLIADGHDVIGLDTGFYQDGHLFSAPSATRRLPALIQKDLRKIEPADLQGLDPELTYRINHEGSVRLAEMAIGAGVRRFVYASSCSVYGVGSNEAVTEESPVNPQTAYARCKTLVERDVGKMATDKFCVVFLRNATAYGASPRMRFAIVLNDLCGACLDDEANCDPVLAGCASRHGQWRGLQCRRRH